MISLTLQRILLVTGPAGIGKTTTVRLIAEKLRIELMEWTEGVDDRSLGSGSGGLLNLLN